MTCIFPFTWCLNPPSLRELVHSSLLQSLPFYENHTICIFSWWTLAFPGFCFCDTAALDILRCVSCGTHVRAILVDVPRGDQQSPGVRGRSALPANTGFPQWGVSLPSHQQWKRTPAGLHLPNNWHCPTQFPSPTRKISLWFAFAFLIPNELEDLCPSYRAVWVSSTVKCPWPISLLDCSFFLYWSLLHGFWILILCQKLLLVSSDEKILIILM